MSRLTILSDAARRKKKLFEAKELLFGYNEDQVEPEPSPRSDSPTIPRAETLLSNDSNCKICRNSKYGRDLLM